MKHKKARAHLILRVRYDVAPPQVDSVTVRPLPAHKLGAEAGVVFANLVAVDGDDYEDAKEKLLKLTRDAPRWSWALGYLRT